MFYRKIEEQDIPQITELYNWYILNGVESFETEPLTVEQMRRRVEDISRQFPYYVAVEDNHLPSSRREAARHGHGAYAPAHNRLPPPRLQGAHRLHHG